MAFSRCGYPPDDIKNTGLKVVINDNRSQGRHKDMGGVRETPTAGITTPNVVFHEVFQSQPPQQAPQQSMPSISTSESSSTQVSQTRQQQSVNELNDDDDYINSDAVINVEQNISE